jgi:hypothetical protein
MAAQISISCNKARQIPSHQPWTTEYDLKPMSLMTFQANASVYLARACFEKRSDQNSGSTASWRRAIEILSAAIRHRLQAKFS